MYHAARDAGVVHMTAFTYRFAPAMRYLKHLVASGALGEPRHFRSQRFLDWPETSWGWRQYKDKAGAGDLFDMTIHRIDFAQDLLGPIDARLRRRGALRAAHDDGRRRGVPAVGRRRLVEHSSASSPAAPPACGKEPRWPRAITATALATNGPRSTAPRARPSISCTSRTRFCWARPATTWRRSTCRRISQAGRQPARSGARRAGHGVSLRSGVGIRLGDRRAGGRRCPASSTDCKAQMVADAVLESLRQRGWVDIIREHP